MTDEEQKRFAKFTLSALYAIGIYAEIIISQLGQPGDKKAIAQKLRLLIQDLSDRPETKQMPADFAKVLDLFLDALEKPYPIFPSADIIPFPFN